MDFEFETTRTSLANAFAGAGAELLAYQPLVSTAVAPIPDTQPQKYAIAGTLPGILQMAGKMMGEEGNAGLEGLTGEALLREIFTRPDLPEYSRENEIRYVMSEEGEIIVTRRDFDAMAEFAKRFVASPRTVAAAEKPTGDLVTRLRRLASDGAHFQTKAVDASVLTEAADEIERLARQSQQAVQTVPEVVREAVAAAFEDRPGWRTKIAAAVRAIDAVAPASQEGAHAALEEVHHQWISMDDRRPEDGETVLIVCHDPHDPEPGMWAAQWLAGSETFESRTNGWVHASEVTHWMPLPPAPTTPACAERSGDHE